jgi:DNA invertase Pin-like site-specific DNA recombinase
MIAATEVAGHEIVGEYVDHKSGRKGSDRRKQFAKLFEDASRRKFDCVLFWALDRFSREGLAATVSHLQRLASFGVSFHSFTEQYLASDNAMVRDILLAVMSSLARVEAQKIGERTKAGMARARAAGKHVGRPRLSQAAINAIDKCAASGFSPYKIAKDLRIDRKTVLKYIYREVLQAAE